MRVKVKHLIFILLLSPTLIMAQEEAAGFTADRPGESTGPDVMPLHRVQWETGVGFSHTFGVDEFTLNNTLIRYGLTRFAEIRVGIDLLHTRQQTGSDWRTSVSALSIGTKIKVLEGDGWKPTVSALAEVECPHIMVHRKVQLDVAANLNLQQPSKYYAVSAGVAWQIN
ncbi:MAG: transporter [Bacteroidales bacterium]|nr:transporter [Bacteroidales bacterium]